MISFIFSIAICNFIGGRFGAFLSDSESRCSGRLIFRCVIPGLIALGATGSIWVWLAVTVGSALWFPWGWSFDEITGNYDSKKYHSFVRHIGELLFPNFDIKSNKKRGILMKGIRGAYDAGTFGLLSFINPLAMIFWIPTFLMGAVYWACGKILGEERYPVAAAEFAWGAIRGLLIYLAIGL